MTFAMPDSFYEPPDVDERDEGCEDGCTLEAGHDDECFTLEDWRSQQADEAYDRTKDGD